MLETQTRKRRRRKQQNERSLLGGTDHLLNPSGSAGPFCSLYPVWSSFFRFVFPLQGWWR